MSSIYIQEPPTLGKVLLETSVGDIDIELWAREAPKATRNFVQLCLEGYYDNTIFHRVVKGFIVQGGDPTGTGEGGESIYGEPFKDEFHSRLRFVRRGLVAMANAEKDDNGSQFFFTLAQAPELQNKHTIFGKVTGNTLFNMLKLEDTLVDRNDRPKYPPKINTAKVLNNPFEDIVPRTSKGDEKSGKKQEAKSKSKATKNFTLLSFGDEAAEDEDEVNEISKEYQGKAKSSHDLANDPELSSVTIAEVEEGKKRDREDDDEEENAEEKLSTEEEVERIRKKLKKDKQEFFKKKMSEPTDNEKTEAIRKEYKQLKKDLAKSKKEAETPVAVKEFKESIDKFDDFKTKKKKKGSAREQETLALLARFQEKLQSVREKEDDDEKSKESEENVENVEDADDERSWLSHTLNFDSREAKVKDANLNDEDTYEISDPRNPITQRRREASKQQMKKR